jgi:riboflavin transporter FmnP
MKNNFIKKITLSALFLAIGFILPMLFGQIPVIGQMLLPMHIPVFLCGLICGWRYGLFIGFILPLARSLIFSVPVMYPTAMAVAVEMAVYGVIVGALYGVAKKKDRENGLYIYAYGYGGWTRRKIGGGSRFVKLRGKGVCMASLCNNGFT